MYKPLSEADFHTLEKLSTKTPSWLERDYPYVPPPGSKGTSKELEFLISLLEEREYNRKFIEVADRNFVALFQVLCRELGVPFEREPVISLMEQTGVLVTKLKWLYNRERPYQFAIRNGVEFSPLESTTAHSPAYPSGHTIQANVLASYFSDLYPQHRKKFMDLAHNISWSRVLGGYHWPSDIIAGRDVARHLLSPSMPSAVRVAALSESEKETREDERLVRQSPKKKPPRRDLERSHVKDKDNSDLDPDEKQDKKDRSQNYKDAFVSRVVIRYAEDREERRDGDTWKTNEGKWSGKFDGKTQMFESEQSAQDYAQGKEEKEQERPSEEKSEPSLEETVLGEFGGLASEDSSKREKALKSLASSVMKNLDEFMVEGVTPDSQMEKEITELLSQELDSEGLDVLVMESQERILGKEKSKDEGYKPTDEEASAIEKEFKKGFVDEFKDKIKDIGERAKDRQEKSRKEDKEKEDNRDISNLKGEEAREMEKHMLSVTKDAVSKYRKMEEQKDRESAMESIEKQMEEFEPGSKRRMELEAERRGLVVSNTLVDGPEAKNVGPSMSVMIQAAEKLGKLDDFLELNLLGGENTAESQQKFRDVIKEVGVRNISDFMPENSPARLVVETLNDTGFISRASPEMREELEEMVIDSLVSGIIFTDAKLNEDMPNASVSKKNKADIKVPQQESIMERLRKLTEKLTKLRSKKASPTRVANLYHEHEMSLQLQMLGVKIKRGQKVSHKVRSNLAHYIENLGAILGSHGWTLADKDEARGKWAWKNGSQRYLLEVDRGHALSTWV